jgi:FtsH-binding integral membrane protein
MYLANQFSNFSNFSNILLILSKYIKYLIQMKQISFSTKQISGSENLLKLFCGIVVTVLVCIAIGHYAFINGKLTCNHYTLNTYLYIVLAVAVMFLVVVSNDQYGIFNGILNALFLSNPFFGFIVLILIMFGLIYLLHSIDPTNIAASNLVWFVLIVITGMIMIPALFYGRLVGVLGMAGILTIAIVIVTGLLGYFLGDKIITFDWDYYLGIALWGLIIAYFGAFFVRDVEKYLYILAIVGLIIFVLLLLSNHKKLRENAEKCVDGKMVPNYPVESYGLVIKIVNVMMDLIRILGRGRGRRFR